MITVLWLVAWLLSNTPALHQWNKWLVSLIVCIVIDVIGDRRVV